MADSINFSLIKDEILLAIEAEKQSVQQKLGILSEILEVDITQGQRVVSEPGAYVYRFLCGLDMHLVEGIEVQVRTSGMSSAGELLDHDIDRGFIQLVLRDNIGKRSPQATMSFDSSFLLDLLKKKIEQLADHDDQQIRTDKPQTVVRDNIRLALDLLSGGAKPNPPVHLQRPGLSESQKTSMSFALGQTVAYLWGPPGTGKTRTVAHLVHELVERSERVMLCAHTNTATDNALLQTLSVAFWKPGSIVRVGYCSERVRKAGVGIEYLVDQTLRRNHIETVRDIERLCDEVEKLCDEPPQLLMGKNVPLGRKVRIAIDLLQDAEGSDKTDLKRKWSELSNLVNNIEFDILANAKVISTTLTRLYTDKLLKRHMCDVMIIDEAGVASQTISLVAACRAKKRVFVIGDFMQLPAIVQSSDRYARNWLGRSVFESAKCDQPDKEHPLRTMLYEQWRMHPDISRIVSNVFYAGKLVDAPVVAQTTSQGPSVLLLDTSSAKTKSQSTRTGSKVNQHHSELVADLVDSAVEREIAVIAPYRAQVRHLRKAIRRKAASALESGRVEVFTVHRFQGRDKQVVILDLVEAPGTKCVFLDEIQNPAAGRLINVAMSRAKEKLVLIANLEHLSRSLGRNALVNQVMAQVRVVGGLELEAANDQDMARCKAFLRGEP